MMNDTDEEYPKTFIKPNITSQMWDDFYRRIHIGLCPFLHCKVCGTGRYNKQVRGEDCADEASAACIAHIVGVTRMVEKSLDTNMWNKKDLYIVSLNMDGLLRKIYSLMESIDE